MPNRIRRALLFMPGDDRYKIEKGAALAVDSVIMDLEDGIALNRKDEARHTVTAALHEVAFGNSERLVRLNEITGESDLWREDINQTIEARPDGYVLPKIETAEQVRMVSETITRAERQYGWLYRSIRLLAIVETAMGIVNLKEIAASDARLSALIFGAEDLAGSMGAMRTPDGWEVFYARSAVVLYARAFGLQAIDTPFVDLAADDTMLLAETEQAHYMGYTGKLAVHPRQIKPIQSVFTPTEEQVRRARALIDAHNAHQGEGRGVFLHEGKMIDMPMIKAARTVLNLARAAEERTHSEHHEE